MTRYQGSYSKCYDRLFEFSLSMAAFVVYMTLTVPVRIDPVTAYLLSGVT